MRIPCKDCLLMSICRHKYYRDLFTDCSLIVEFIFMNRPQRGCQYPYSVRKCNERIVLAYKVLKPTKWEAQIVNGNIRISRKIRATFGGRYWISEV